jgi:hypothetical protein
MKNDPRMMTAKETLVCEETGTLIEVGERYLFYPLGGHVFCTESNEYVSWCEWMFDLEWL